VNEVLAAGFVYFAVGHDQRILVLLPRRDVVRAWFDAFRGFVTTTGTGLNVHRVTMAHGSECVQFRHGGEVRFGTRYSAVGTRWDLIYTADPEIPLEELIPYSHSIIQAPV
jgi:hypothetical protein